MSITYGLTNRTGVKKFDESQHPRSPGGSPKGGQFTIAGTALPGTSPGVNVLSKGGATVHVDTSQQGEDWIKRHQSPDTGNEPGSRTNPIDCGADIEKAAKLIAEGKHVTLDQPDQVSTLVAKIKGEYDAAIAAGQKPPVWNIAAISVKGTNLFAVENLNIPRVEMPQLGGRVDQGSKAQALMPEADRSNPKAEIDLTDRFIKGLLASGIKSELRGGPGEPEMFADHVRSTQNELDGAKVGAIAALMKAGKLREGGRVTVTRDNYMLDGHHRWAATIVNDLQDNHPGDLTIKVNMLDIDIGTALSLGRAFQEEWGISAAALKFARILRHLLHHRS